MNSRKGRDSLPNEFHSEGKIITNTQEIADKLNQYFSNIGKKLNSEVPNSTKKYNDYYPDRANTNTIYLRPTDPLEVLQLVRKLKAKTSLDKDNLSTKMLKCVIEELLMPITHIINLSLIQGRVPDDLKIAKVIPIFKSGDKSKFNNYRPISLLPIISKILERIIYNRITHFIEQNNYFYKHQYGFRKGHSTIHPIIHFLNYLHNAKENRPSKLTVGLFLDLSKAFDTISHEILLSKLNIIGIRGKTNDLIRDYLTNRKQYTEITGKTSSITPITCGVPQGSILGPLLFLLYINDIQNIPIESEILSFADDTTLFITGKNIQNLQNKANMESKHLYEWLCANKLSLNVSKTKYILFGATKNQSLNFNIKINNQNIEQISDNNPTKSITFLGVHIDEKLTWKYHINLVNKKIANATFAINNVKNFIPKRILKMLYQTLVQPHLTYNILCWGNPNNAHIKKTFTLQKRAIRTINNAKYNDHTEPLFKRNKLLKLNDLFTAESIRFLIKLENNKLPSSFDGVFILNRVIHPGRVTRQNNLYSVKLARTKLTKNLPSCCLPKIWNKWKAKIPKTINKHFLKLVTIAIMDEYQYNIHCDNNFCLQCR